jgi:hypothetical protein
LLRPSFLQACGADDELSEEDVEAGEVDSIAQRLTQLVQEVGGGVCVSAACEVIQGWSPQTVQVQHFVVQFWI